MCVVVVGLCEVPRVAARQRESNAKFRCFFRPIVTDIEFFDFVRSDSNSGGTRKSSFFHLPPGGSVELLFFSNGGSLKFENETVDNRYFEAAAVIRLPGTECQRPGPITSARHLSHWRVFQICLNIRSAVTSVTHQLGEFFPKIIFVELESAELQQFD